MVAFDCAIDMLAGPTEAIVFADHGNPEFFAADLVAQAEHDPETLPIFVTTNVRLAQEVAKAAMAMAAGNPIACKSLSENGVALVARDADEAFVWINAIAAEHLTVDAANLHRVSDAGSVFVGEYSPQSLGDYASGPNHVLPTGGMARYRGGLSVLDYLKIVSVQQVSKSGLKRIAPTVALLACLPGAPGSVAGWRRLRPVRWRMVALRSVVHSGASLTWYVAWQMGMSLADSYAIGFCTPLLMTVLAVPLLGERIHWRRAASTALGFAGVLVMLRPGGALWTPAALARSKMARPRLG